MKGTPSTAMITWPDVNDGSRSWQSERAPDRIELVAALAEARCRVDVVVSAQPDHEVVRIVRSAICHDTPRDRIDGSNRLLTELDAGFVDVAVEAAHVFERLSSEHQFELRETEHERLALVDQRDVDVFAEGLRKAGRHFKPAESGAQHDYVCAHGA